MMDWLRYTNHITKFFPFTDRDSELHDKITDNLRGAVAEYLLLWVDYEIEPVRYGDYEYSFMESEVFRSSMP